MKHFRRTDANGFTTEGWEWTSDDPFLIAALDREAAWYEQKMQEFLDSPLWGDEE